MSALDRLSDRGFLDAGMSALPRTDVLAVVRALLDGRADAASPFETEVVAAAVLTVSVIVRPLSAAGRAAVVVALRGLGVDEAAILAASAAIVRDS